MPQSRVGPTARVTGVPATAAARVNLASLTPALTRANAMPVAEAEPEVSEAAAEPETKAPKAKKRK